MPFRFYHDTFFKEGFLMFIKDFIETAIKFNIPNKGIKVMNVTQRESTRPEMGSADLCFEANISDLQDKEDHYMKILLIVEHKSFYEQLAIFSQVKYHNGFYQEQMSFSKELLPVISLFCCHGKGSSKTPKSIKEVLLKKRSLQSSFDLFNRFILHLEWLLLDFSDKKVLSLFKEKESYYIAYIFHQGLDFKVTEESLLEIIRLMSRIKNPYKRSRSIESVLTYIENLSPGRMTDTMLQNVDLRAKRESLLKKGESIVKYTSMRELVRAEAREKGLQEGRIKGIEEGRKEGVEKGVEKGIEKGRQEVALQMLKQNMQLQLITQLTGLSIHQIEKLKK